MGITPIERIRAWWAGIWTRCANCPNDSTFRSAGSGYRYRYCSDACALADAEAQESQLL